MPPASTSTSSGMYGQLGSSTAAPVPCSSSSGGPLPPYAEHVAAVGSRRSSFERRAWQAAAAAAAQEEGGGGWAPPGGRPGGCVGGGQAADMATLGARYQALERSLQEQAAAVAGVGGSPDRPPAYPSNGFGRPSLSSVPEARDAPALPEPRLSMEMAVTHQAMTVQMQAQAAATRLIGGTSQGVWTSGGGGGGGSSRRRAQLRPSMEARRRKLDFTTLKDRKVLLAEDNLINQTVARKMLQSLGMQCEVACNGKEAVTAVQRAAAADAVAATARGAAAAAGGSEGQERLAGRPAGGRQQYDVVLMDMAMPVMGGVAATRAIRNAGLSLPIVAMTANASDKDRDECMSAGMDGFLSKPVLKERLAVAIMLAISGRATYKDEDTVALKPFEQF